MQHVWTLFLDSLNESNRKFPASIFCYVLMANHYHLLIQTPDENIDEFMGHFNKRFSQKMRFFSKQINHKFANRYKWTIINHPRYLNNVYRYIYQNPIRAGVSTTCLEYPYTSLNAPLKVKKFHSIAHLEYEENKLWFEKIMCEEKNIALKKALGRTIFHFPVKTRKGVIIELENERLTSKFS